MRKRGRPPKIRIGDEGRRPKNAPFWMHHGLKNRCLNPNNKDYPNYGGRGVKLCTEWYDYETFRVWAIMHGWHKGMELDRIDPLGDYCPNNCQWLSKLEHRRKTGNARKRL